MTALKYFIQQELEKLQREQLKQVFEFSEIWMANFEPKQGSQEGGVRPTIIFPNDYYFEVYDYSYQYSSHN